MSKFEFKSNFALDEASRNDVKDKLSKYKLYDLRILKENENYYFGARFHINMDEANKQRKIIGDNIYVSMPNFDLALLTFTSMIKKMESKYKAKFRIFKETMIKVRLKKFEKNYYAKYIDDDDYKNYIERILKEKEKKQNV